MRAKLFYFHCETRKAEKIGKSFFNNLLGFSLEEKRSKKNRRIFSAAPRCARKKTSPKLSAIKLRKQSYLRSIADFGRWINQ